MLQCSLRTRFPNRVATLLVIINEHGQQLGKFLFFWRRVVTFVETQQLVCETLTFLIRVNDMGQSTTQQLPVCFLAKIDRYRAQRFQATSSYSECVNGYNTKSLCAI
jgi:hypothetical protein